MQKKPIKEVPKASKKQEDFQKAYDKYTAMLPKEYFDDIKKAQPKYVKVDQKQKVKNALRTGQRVEVVNKSSGNKAHHQNINIGKILNDDIIPEIKTVPRELAIQVEKAREAKEWTQDKLAKEAQEKLVVIKEIESATGPYDPEVIAKIERVLGTKFDRSWKKK